MKQDIALGDFFDCLDVFLVLGFDQAGGAELGGELADGVFVGGGRRVAGGLVGLDTFVGGDEDGGEELWDVAWSVRVGGWVGWDVGRRRRKGKRGLTRVGVASPRRAA